MKKVIFTAMIAVFMLVTSMEAQDYKSAIGAKLGYGLIGSYKTFLNEKAAVDIFAGIRWGGIAAGAYYLNHKPISSVDRLTWYWGFGGSYTTWDFGVSDN